MKQFSASFAVLSLPYDSNNPSPSPSPSHSLRSDFDFTRYALRADLITLPTRTPLPATALPP